MSNIIEQELVKMHYDTFGDIVREMRECAADCTAHGCRDMDRFADRIEAAYKRNRAYQESKCAANEELARKLTKQREINKELVDENARLKAAFKVALDWGTEREECRLASACIITAKRIYNEGAMK